jgi:hypothetical protein
VVKLRGSGIKMAKVLGRVTIKEVFFEPVEHGGVFVYEIENDDEDNDIFFDYFYIATFDDDSGEAVWGVGYDIESALENAEREWEREEGDENPNPFREALEEFKIRKASEISEKDKNT